MYQLSNLSHYELSHCRELHLDRRHSLQLLFACPEQNFKSAVSVACKMKNTMSYGPYELYRIIYTAYLELSGFSFHFMLLFNPVSCKVENGIHSRYKRHQKRKSWNPKIRNVDLIFGSHISRSIEINHRKLKCIA